MYKNTLVYGLILIATFILPSTTSAADVSKQSTKEKTSIELQREQTQSHAHKIMGHINLAQFALSLELPDEAIHHIKKAQNLETQLWPQLPELKISSLFKYGKVTYDDNQTFKEHYIPIMDDTFLISDYEAIFEHSKKQGMKAVNAGVVHVSASVDLREVKTGLDAALEDINKNEYNKAQNALDGIFNGIIVNEEEIDDPILAISENLSLAKSFLKHKQYDHARSTLKYVQKRLVDVDKAGAEKLSADLDKLKVALRKEDPTMTERISDQLGQWKRTVNGWVN